MNARTCPICKAEAVSPHHIIPKSEGGTDDRKNIAWLCKRCHDRVEEVYYMTGVMYCPSVVQFVQDELGINRLVKEEVSRKLKPRKSHRLSEFDTMRIKLRKLKESARILLVLAPSEGGRRAICGQCGQEFFCHDNRFSMCGRCRKLLAARLNLPSKTAPWKILGSVTDRAIAAKSYRLKECYLMDNAFYFTKYVDPSEALESLTCGYCLMVSEVG